MRSTALLLLAGAALALTACGGDDTGAQVDAGVDAAQVGEGACQIADPGAPPDSLSTITCKADFDALASEPLDVTLPGARSTKVVLDRQDGDAIYFQNSVKFQIHYAFASTHLSGNGHPVVGSLADFNSTEYFMPDRRFLLGAVTYYEQPQKWVLELAPYDTMTADMIETLFLTVKHAGYFGPELAFHPTSEALSTVAATLPPYVPVVTTDQLYAGIDYQPLSLGTAYGRIHFTTAAALESEFLSFQDIPVLDEAPNDISVVQGLITQEFQTPLSHVNVLSRNRHTPNMGLRNALTNPMLRALDGQLVKLTVTAQAWSVEPATAEEAQAWWDTHAPPPVTLPAVDLTKTQFADIEDVTSEATETLTLRDAIKAAVQAYGGKAAHYSLLYKTPGIPIKRAFAIPIYYYDQFMEENHFFDRVDGFLADPSFNTDPAVRDAALAQLRADILNAPLDANFMSLLAAKAATFPVAKLRFRSSSNSEDLDGFPCAGCYNSYSGATSDLQDMALAIRKVYADVWTFRTFEERTYYRVDHRSVGMALLVHENFEAEEANGVAVTANPFDESGLDPALYINVQAGGDVEVVAPPPGTTSDQILYYFDQPNQPITYLTHSNIIDAGTTVLTTRQINSLGAAMKTIHARFSPAYGPASGNDGWYAMDIEFKFDDEATPGTPTLYVKQARPYPDPFAAFR
ncbi:MAG TPA: PEP/pyruvate-binding domain-containing protein [Kofleriaceae bacterium]|nr:PEP/pyruvate-binding domain-containing protein [Kofleriaceae bacterium]